ncbi:MAG TPA: hypothetical protein VK014_03820 [Cyclobacteriaceae bacterium]|nr:hypothetical protein [Cyclobacteriaceae bacterium]
MKWFLALSLFFYCLAAPAQRMPMEELRSLYKRAAVEKEACETALTKLETVKLETNPLLFGYKGSVTMMMAQHVSNPFNKLSYFHKGKNMLDEAIQADNSNTELRFLRFAAQTNAPAMLGYRGNVEVDKKLILEALPTIDDASLKRLIVDYLVNSEFLNTEEKDKLVKA